MPHDLMLSSSVSISYHHIRLAAQISRFKTTKTRIHGVFIVSYHFAGDFGPKKSRQKNWGWTSQGTVVLAFSLALAATTRASMHGRPPTLVDFGAVGNELDMNFMTYEISLFTHQFIFAKNFLLNRCHHLPTSNTNRIPNTSASTRRTQHGRQLPICGRAPQTPSFGPLPRGSKPQTTNQVLLIDVQFVWFVCLLVQLFVWFC